MLIRGASGTGKSGLALQLIAYGAVLVSDDRTQLFRQGAAVYADAPDTIRGMIEARHVGLLQTLCSGPVKLVLIVDMDCQETDRLPPQRQETLLGVALQVVRESVQFVKRNAVHSRPQRLPDGR